MSELVALTRVAIARHRVATTTLLAIVVLSELIAWFASRAVAGHDGETVAALALFVSLLPAGIAAMVLFDYGQQHDLMSPRSGCIDWLLLSPLASWKIAAVPIVLKTIWISGVWLLFALTAPTNDVLPRFTPCLCFSGAMIWLLAIAWRPFRSGWARLGAVVISMPLLYVSLVFTLAASQSSYAGYSTAATALSIVIYALAVGLALHAVKLARTCGTGIIPETQRRAIRLESAVLTPGDDLRREFGSPVRALVWHDLARTSGCIRYTVVLGVIPAIVLATVLMPLHGASVGVVMVVFTYLAGFSCIGIGGALDDRSSLPAYLAVSPVDTATIAWTRLATVLAIIAAVGCSIVFVFLGWSFWEVNRMNWFRWASGLVDAQQTSDDVIWVGVRWSIAIVLASAVTLAGRLIGYLWVSMIDRTWVQHVVTFTASLIVLGLLLFVSVWFIYQTDWESAEASARAWLAYLPTVIVGLLLIKGVLAIAAAGQLIRSRLATGHTVAMALAIWIALTLAVASAISVLIPDPRVTFVWCLAAATLAIPLARVLILPMSLSLNRHR